MATLKFSDKKLGVIDAIVIPDCFNHRWSRCEGEQVYCDLNSKPCIMYDGDSLNGRMCDYYTDKSSSDNIHPSYHHSKNILGNK